jgi:hypothetical protein
VPVGINKEHSAGTVNQNPFFDMRSNAFGAAVPIFCLVAVGAPTGTPDSFSVIASIRQSASSDGSSSVAVEDCYMDANGDLADSVTLTEGNTETCLRFELSGDYQYFGLRIVVAFVNGTTPKVPVAAFFVSEKKTW